MTIKFGAHLVDTFCLEHHLGALRRSAVFSVFLLGACGSGSVPSVELEAGEVQVSVSPHSESLHSIPLHSEHGYARVHTISIYIYITEQGISRTHLYTQLLHGRDPPP